MSYKYLTKKKTIRVSFKFLLDKVKLILCINKS